MVRSTRAALAAVWLAGLIASSARTAPAAREEMRSVATRSGVTERFLLVHPGGAPVASVILFAGGDGALNLSDQGIGGLGGNFLVRTRQRFARDGLLVAVIDAPSDRGSLGLAGFRTSADHARDVQAVIAALRREAEVPVWVVGTSNGTISAANAAARLREGGPAGLVLTSAVTTVGPGAARSHIGSVETVRDVRLGDVRVPTLLVHHKKDGCLGSPYEGASALLKRLDKAPRKELLTFEGGLPPKSDPCEAFSAHGYLGLEAEVVSAITAWIRAATPQN
jgi:hypothetical protein